MPSCSHSDYLIPGSMAQPGDSSHSPAGWFCAISQAGGGWRGNLTGLQGCFETPLEPGPGCSELLPAYLPALLPRKRRLGGSWGAARSCPDRENFLGAAFSSFMLVFDSLRPGGCCTSACPPSVRRAQSCSCCALGRADLCTGAAGQCKGTVK